MHGLTDIQTMFALSGSAHVKSAYKMLREIET